MLRIRKIIFDKRLGLLLLLVLAFTVPIFAPPLPPPGPPQPPAGGGGGAGAPIEGGLIYLLMMGVSYGINKIRSIKKKIA